MNIPEDIVDEILSRLPVKSLLKFKLVCKDWYVKIQSDSFIAIHNKNQRTNEKILIQYHNEYIDDGNVFLIYSEEDVVEDDTKILFYQSSIQQYYIKDMPLRDFGYHSFVDVIDTCNGLVCLDDYGCSDPRMINLWNPATREFQTLPPFNLPPQNPGAEKVGETVGFGFFCTTNDYKVIHFLQFQKEQSEGFTNVMKIYSLSENCWKEYDCSDLSTKIYVRGKFDYWFEFDCSQYDDEEGGDALFLNRKFYWVAMETTTSSSNHLILAFDIYKEVFQTIPLPSDYMELVKSFGNLGVELLQLHDSIAVLLYESCIYGIWTMKDLEQGCSSWIKMSNIATSEMSIALGFWNRRGDELLFLFEECDGDIVATDCNKNSIKKIIVKNCKGGPESFFTYVETLVSLNRS